MEDLWFDLDLSVELSYRGEMQYQVLIDQWHLSRTHQQQRLI